MQTGMLVKSLKGHDSGRLYVVIKLVSDEFALIADGKIRKTDKLKLKRIKHLKILFFDSGPALIDMDKVTDVKIAKFIKDHTKKVMR